MKKVFVAFFSTLLIAILLSTSNVNAKVDVNIKEEVILGEKENEKEEVILGGDANKPCVQSLSIGGSQRRTNGHQNKDWYSMGSYVSRGNVSSSCFKINYPNNMINVRLNGTNFEYSPLGHGKFSVTVTVPSNCTCSGEIISRSAGFTFSEWGLNGLSITGYDISPEFNNMKMEYAATVPNKVASIEIYAKPVASDSTITITLNDATIVKDHVGTIKATIDNLKVGENKVKINVVTQPEGDSRDTYITVTRSTSNDGSSSGSGDSNDENKTDSQTNSKAPTSSIFLVKDSCFNPDILRIVRFILVLIDIVRFVVPMALIVYGAIDFSKAAVAGDEKAQKEKVNLFVKRLINAVALFLIPVIVEFLIVFLGDLANGANFTDCIQNANKEKIAELQEELDKKREEIANENEETILEEKNDYDYITYIGDSRTVGMCGVVQLSDKENCTIAESGMGYSWLTSYDIKNKLDKVLTEHKNSYVIINMGTNSYLSFDEGKKYAIYYNELSKKYPTSKIVAISVTQVVLENARKHGMYTHERYNNPEAYSVKRFNEGLKSNLDSNVKYCDVYSALDKRGYDTKDGVHYTPETYKVIYEEIQKCLKR